jgi:hypothetical protein
LVVDKPKGDGFFQKKVDVHNIVSEQSKKNNHDFEENLSDESDNFKDLSPKD